jgi:hypothetical protein
VPDEAVAAVFTAAEGSERPIRLQDAMAIVKPYMPPKPPKPRPFLCQDKPVRELPPPAPEPEPQTIEAEYTVLSAQLTFADWLAAMPTDLSVGDHLAILELAKGSATKLRNQRPSLYNAVSNAIPAWSVLILAVEKELRQP